MDMYLYNTMDDNNILNKTLIDEKHILEIRLKQPVDIINPNIILRNDGFLLYNYAYIPEFQRYYFIENITNKNKDTFEILLKVDVLMSFKDDILLSKGYIVNDSLGNKYLDLDTNNEMNKDFYIYNSDKELEPTLEHTIILNIFGR